MKKKVKVHLLPTEKAKLYIDGRKLYYNPTTMHIPVKPQPQHLYFTSDEKIEEGDWCILLENHYINGGVGKYNKEKAIGYGLHNTKFFRKIVATTDKSLKIYESETLASASGFNLKTDDILLPQIPQSFIKEYVKSGGKIDEVEIELDCYEDRQCECKNNSECLNIGIKVDSNNCVIVHSIKDSWSREEVEKLLLLAFNANRYSIARQEDWIKENMK